MADDLDRIEESLPHQFADRQLLELALTHRSLTAETPGLQPNERLEFLGDAVLGLVVADLLYTSGELSEGEMAKVRAAVVNEASLAAVARTIGVGGAIRLGHGEDASGGREKSSILADAMEAVLGAVYLDGGLAVAAAVVEHHWRVLIAERTLSPGRRDYKTRLQEIAARDGTAPTYDVAGTGPDHDRHFAASVSIEGRLLGRGEGSSKKRAEQAAARAALEALDADA